MEEVAGLIGRFLFWLIFETLITLTGEVILWILTLGKHKPRWDLNTSESSSRFVLFTELSFWVGLSFWIIVVVTVLWLVG